MPFSNFSRKEKRGQPVLGCNLFRRRSSRAPPVTGDTASSQALFTQRKLLYVCKVLPEIVTHSGVLRRGVPIRKEITHFGVFTTQPSCFIAWPSPGEFLTIRRLSVQFAVTHEGTVV